jgi:hypothetical protein
MADWKGRSFRHAQTWQNRQCYRRLKLCWPWILKITSGTENNFLYPATRNKCISRSDESPSEKDIRLLVALFSPLIIQRLVATEEIHTFALCTGNTCHIRRTTLLATHFLISFYHYYATAFYTLEWSRTSPQIASFASCKLQPLLIKCIRKADKLGLCLYGFDHTSYLERQGCQLSILVRNNLPVCYWPRRCMQGRRNAKNLPNPISI